MSNDPSSASESGSSVGDIAPEAAERQDESKTVAFRKPGSAESAPTQIDSQQSFLVDPNALPQIRGYEVTEILGTGGMGAVYRARDLKLNRDVAIKMVLEGRHASPQLLARFESEARATARLHHPNIVQVFASGEHNGHPYLALEYVDGTTLSKFTGGEPQPQRFAAGIVREIAKAMDYAHGLAVVHRDLKPGNILLTTSTAARSDTTTTDAASDPASAAPELAFRSSAGIDAGPATARPSESTLATGIDPATASHSENSLFLIPKVTDFGIAKLEDSDLEMTAQGQVLGTVQYMSPEQADGENMDVNHLTDMYAMGAILYYLLTGRPPFQGTSSVETMVKVRDAAPIPPRQLQSGVSRDLETICLKCLEKNPLRRYQSSAELAAELGRYLSGEPIQARPVSPAEKLWRHCVRNPLTAALSAALGIVLVCSFVVLALAWKQSSDAQKELEKKSNEQRQQLATMRVSDGRDEIEAGNLLGSLPYFVEALRLESDDQEAATRHRTRIASVLRNAPRLEQILHLGSEVSRISFSNDGTRLAAGGANGSLCVWDSRTGEPLMDVIIVGRKFENIWISNDNSFVITNTVDGAMHRIPISKASGERLTLEFPTTVVRAAISPDGQTVAAGCRRGSIYIIDADTMKILNQTSISPSDYSAIRFSPNGELIAAGNDDGVLQIFDAATGEHYGSSMSHDGRINNVCFSKSNQRLASASDDTTVKVWDVETKTLQYTSKEHSRRVRLVEFSPDDRLLLSAGDGGVAILKDAVNGKVLHDGMTHPNLIQHASFDQSSRMLATASNDHTARVWDTRWGEPLTPPLPHNYVVTMAVFAPHSLRLATASEDGVVKIWRLRDEPIEDVRVVHDAPLNRAILSNNEKYLVSLDQAGEARLTDIDTGGKLATFEHSAALSFACFSNDSSRLLTADESGEARLWSIPDGQALSEPMPHAKRVSWASFFSNNELIVTASGDGRFRVWNGRTGRMQKVERPHRSGINSAAISSDETLVATASTDGTSQILRLPELTPVASTEGHGSIVEGVAFSPDSTTLVSVGRDHVARFWQSRTGRKIPIELRHDGGIVDVEFSRDANRVLTGGRDGTAQIWDARTGSRLTPPIHHGRGLIRTKFSRDGSMVATVGGDFSAYLWHAATGELISAGFEHQDWVSDVAFSSDGTRLITASHDGTARIRKIAAPDNRPVSTLRMIAGVLSGTRVEQNGGLVSIRPSDLRTTLRRLHTLYGPDFATATELSSED